MLSTLVFVPSMARGQSAAPCGGERQCGWSLASDLTVGLAVRRADADPFSRAGPFLLTGTAGLMRALGRHDAVGLVAFASGERVESVEADRTLATRMTFGLAARYRHAVGHRAYIEAQAGLPFSGQSGVSRRQVSPLVGLTWHPSPSVGIGAKLVTENYAVRVCPGQDIPACLAAPMVTTAVNDHRWYLETRLSGRYGAAGAAAALVALMIGVLGPPAGISW
jgi:hypothetical protein